MSWGAKLSGKPHDGHTLRDQLQQVEILKGHKPIHCYVDRGYREHGIKDIDIKISGQLQLRKRYDDAVPLSQKLAT